MNSLIITFLLLVVIKSQSIGNLILDFSLTYDQLVTQINIGKGEKNTTNYFQIDISSNKSWILHSKLNLSVSSSFKKEETVNNLTRDNLSLNGQSASDVFHFGGLTFEDNEKERLNFTSVDTLKGEPENIGGLGFGNYMNSNEHPAFLMNNKLNKDGGKFVLEITRDPTSEYTNGHIVVGDNVSGNLLNTEIYVTLDNEIEKYKNSWVTKVKNVFFGNVLREKNNDGTFVLNVNKYPNFAMEAPATFETIYNRIYVPYEIHQDFFNKIDKEYFLFNGLHKCFSVTDNDIIKYTCPLEDVAKLGQLHFILSDDLDIYLDEFDLFTCNNTHCNSTIEANPNIKDRWVLGIPVLRKFTCVFQPTIDNNQPKMSLISTRNKVKVSVQGKPSEPLPYLSASFKKGEENLIFPVLMGTNMVQAYFTIDINGNTSFVHKDIHDNTSQKYQPMGNETEFDYGEFKIKGYLMSDQFTLANISVTTGSIVLANNITGGHKYKQYLASISASKKDHTFLTALLNNYGSVDKGEPGFLLQYDDKPNNDHMGYFMIGDFQKYIDEQSKYVSLLTLTNNPVEWESEINYIFFKDYLEEKDKNNLYKINLANPHYSKKTKVVFETVYSQIIVPYDDRDTFKYYLTQYYFKVDDENLCIQEYTNEKWEITCTIEEYRALGQIHFLLDTTLAVTDGDLDIFLDNNDLFECGEVNCTFGINIDPYNKDRFIFGNNVLKQFKTFFGLKENNYKILLIGDYNKANVVAYGKQQEEKKIKYIEGDFEIKNGLMYTKLLIGSPYQEIPTILDLSGVHTWVHDTLYDQEKSKSKTKKNQGQINYENFHVSGDFYDDKINFATASIFPFDFQVVSSTDIDELPYKSAIGLGRTTYKNEKHEELTYSMITKVYEYLNINAAHDKFMIKFNTNVEKENYGKIYIGEFDDLIDLTEFTDELKMDEPKNNSLGKWSPKATLTGIYFHNILTKKTEGGYYNVSQNLPHMDIDNLPVYFESRFNKIILPDNFASDVFKHLAEKYFIHNGEPICQKIESGGNPIGYYCKKNETKMLDQIHFVFDNQFDIYLEREDLFDCVEERCNFLIVSEPKFNDGWYFGIPVLKQFITVFERNGDSASIKFKGKTNKAHLKFYDDSGEKVKSNYEVTSFEINKDGIIQMYGTIGTTKVPFSIDINGKKSWIDEKIYRCDKTKITSSCQELEDEQFTQDSFTISGKKIKDTFKLREVTIDLELISAKERVNTNLTGAISLSKTSDIIPQFLTKLSADKIEVTENSYFLRFGGEGPNGENIGTLYYGNLNSFITENELKTESIECDTELKDKWSTRLKAMYFKNYLTNNINGVYNVSNETYRSYTKNLSVVFETIYNVIYFPYEIKEELFSRLKDLYFNVENQTLNCTKHGDEKTDLMYYVCNKEVIKSLGQIHFLIQNNISIYLDAPDLFRCSGDDCEFLIQANKNFTKNIVLGLPMLKKFDFVFDYKKNTILLLSDSNKAKLRIEGEIHDDSGGGIIKIIWSFLQILLLIIVILLGLGIVGVGVIYFFKTKNASRTNATVDQGPMQKLTMNEQK